MISREELERLIVDASDGVLNAFEIENLEKELQNHPDLYQDYKSIIKLPDFSNAYQADMKTDRHHSAMNRIRKSIYQSSKTSDSFEMITLNWFRRYALAASLAVFAITSLFSFIQAQNEQAENDVAVEELFYPAGESMADNYVLYLEDLTEE